MSNTPIAASAVLTTGDPPNYSGTWLQQAEASERVRRFPEIGPATQLGRPHPLVPYLAAPGPTNPSPMAAELTAIARDLGIRVETPQSSVFPITPGGPDRNGDVWRRVGRIPDRQPSLDEIAGGALDAASTSRDGQRRQMIDALIYAARRDPDLLAEIEQRLGDLLHRRRRAAGVPPVAPRATSPPVPPAAVPSATRGSRVLRPRSHRDIDDAGAPTVEPSTAPPTTGEPA